MSNETNCSLWAKKLNKGVSTSLTDIHQQTEQNRCDIATVWSYLLAQTRFTRKHSFDLVGNPTHDLRIRSTISLPTELRGRTEKLKSGTIEVVNRGEEEVGVHMNVVPRSTMNTNGGTEN